MVKTGFRILVGLFLQTLGFGRKQLVERLALSYQRAKLLVSHILRRMHNTLHALMKTLGLIF